MQNSGLNSGAHSRALWKILLLMCLASVASLALLHGSADGQETDQSRKAALAEREASCNKGNGDDCQGAAMRWENGVYGRHPDRANEFWVKACNLEYYYGCYSAGNFYAKDKTDPQRVALAAKYYGLACKMGDGNSCRSLKALGAAGAQAAADAGSQSAKLCSAGDASACNNLGVSYAKGEMGPPDKTRAMALFDRGCKLANQTACGNLKALQDEQAKSRRDAAYSAAVAAAAQPNPSRPAGAELSAADRACLRAGTETYEYTERGACIRGDYDRLGQLHCEQYDRVTRERERLTLTNICRAPVSFKEYCGNSPFANATILPGEKYVRRFGSPCRLAY